MIIDETPKDIDNYQLITDKDVIDKLNDKFGITPWYERNNEKYFLKTIGLKNALKKVIK